MNKKYIYRSIFLITMLTIGACQLMAQNKKSGKLSDTIKIINDQNNSNEIVPGTLIGVSKLNSTAAVSTVSGSTLYNTPTASITNTFYGLLPGMTVRQGSGEPGFDIASLAIRGIGTYGVSGYKIYVDGFEVDNNYLNYLAPAELESVSILKDAAALATFGMKGANGVLWVVTKRGKPGKSTITFQTRSGMQSPINNYKPLDSYGYANLYNQAVSNDNGMVWTPKYLPSDLQGYQNGTGTNVDWRSQAIKNNSNYSDADLIFAGGDNNSRYNVVFDYANQQGLYNVANTDISSNEKFARYNLRTNLDFTLFKIFDAKVDIGGILENRKSPNYTSNFSTGKLWNDLLNYPSNIYPVYDTTGTNGANTHLSGTTIYPNNPVGSIQALGWQSNLTRVLQGNFSLKERLDFITPGLYLSEAVSFNSYDLSTYNKTATYARYINGATTTTDKTTTIAASGLGANTQEDWKQLQATVGYSRQFGVHTINSAVNFLQSTFRGDNGVFNYATHYQNLSGKANYTYKNRYVGEFGFSYFGSDAYAPGHNWGFYPAISAAWIVSNEGFLKNNKVISFLKLRSSVGKSGNADASSPSNFASGGRYLYQQYYAGNGSTFYQNNTAPAGANMLNPLFVANPDAFAEQSIKYNVGADFTLLKNLNITVDVFMDKRSGILTQDNSIPSYFGNNIYFRNIGKMTNKGYEISASYSNKAGKIGYNVFGMTSVAKNTIDYSAELAPAYSYNASTGRAQGTPIGLVSNGFYQVEDFNADGTLKSGQAVPFFGKVQPGDIKYKDLDGNGKIDQNDVTQVGKPNFPSLNYSFGGSLNFKGFDFNILFQGSGGNSVYLLNVTGMQGFVNNGNAFPIQQNAWAYYPTQGIDTRATALYPRLTTLANNNNYRTSDFWMRNGDFLRIRNVELGYSLSAKSLSKVMLSKLRFYVNAVNPITWSSLLKNYEIDPESLSGYPALKSVNVGVVAIFK